MKNKKNRSKKIYLRIKKDLGKKSLKIRKVLRKSIKTGDFCFAPPPTTSVISYSKNIL